MRLNKINTAILQEHIMNLLNEGKYKLNKTSMTIDLPEPDVPKTKPTLIFSYTAELKIDSLVAMCDTECAWHGIIAHIPGTDVFKVEDILVYPQKVYAAFVESDDELYPNWLNELDDDTFYKCRMQGHSHVNMPVSPSPQDLKYYDELMSLKPDYYIFMIANKRDQVYVEIRDEVHNVIYETNDIDIKYMSDMWANEQLDTHTDRKKKQVKIYPYKGGKK